MAEGDGAAREEMEAKLLTLVRASFPQYPGYRRREDLRATDRAVRDHLADRIGRTRGRVTAARTSLSEAFVTEGVDGVGALAARLKSVEDTLRAPSAGVTAGGPGGRFAPGELEKFYAADQESIESAAGLEQAVVPLQHAARAGDGAAVTAQIERFRHLVAGFEETWQLRQRRVAGLE